MPVALDAAWRLLRACLLCVYLLYWCGCLFNYLSSQYSIRFIQAETVKPKAYQQIVVDTNIGAHRPCFCLYGFVLSVSSGDTNVSFFKLDNLFNSVIIEIIKSLEKTSRIHKIIVLAILPSHQLRHWLYPKVMLHSHPKFIVICKLWVI